MNISRAEKSKVTKRNFRTFLCFQKEANEDEIHIESKIINSHRKRMLDFLVLFYKFAL